jgi:plastocyanin
MFATRQGMARLTAALFAFAVAALVAVAVACGGGSGGSNNNPTGPSGGGTTQPTITITAGGVDPREINIRSGQTVLFVNNDSRPHQMLTTPHLRHDDCPPINNVDTLAPGASRMTGGMTVSRICGYHDHMNPEDNRFRGQINVDTSEGPAPGYIRP